MPNVRFGRKLPNSQDCIDTQAAFEPLTTPELDWHMQLLELSLTPGIHTIEYESQQQADQAIQQIISLLIPFMHVGIYGIEGNFNEAVFDLSNASINTDFDVIFVNSQTDENIKNYQLLSSHGTKIIVDIKSKPTNQ